MKIRVLGTRGQIKPTAPQYALHSGVLIDGMLLLDLGEKEFLFYHPRWIFLTHLHPDHAVFVVEPLSQKLPPIYAPENYEWVDIDVMKGPVTVGDYSITPIPTHHSIKVKSQAYVIRKGNESLLYTGDMIWIDKQYHPLFDDMDLIITEASYIHEGGVVRKDKTTGGLYGHTGVPNLLQLFKDSSRHILLMHFGSWFYRDIEESKQKLLALGKEHGVTLHIAHDGMELDTARLA